VCYAFAVARPSFISPILLLTPAPVLVAQSRTNWDTATGDALMAATSRSQEALSRTMVTRVPVGGDWLLLRTGCIGLVDVLLTPQTQALRAI
jgi:hypothetical protein